MMNSSTINIPAEWNWETFDECIIPKAVSTRKIPEKLYLSEGLYPIIDQGSRRIAGYTNEKDALYKHEAPVIVFGDHTRILKYINFDFAVGADGTKIIHPNIEKVYPKYFFYILMASPIPNDGYNRHFKHLKALKLPFPPTQDEQIKIAKMLEDKERCFRSTQSAAEQQLEALHALPSAELRSLFSQKDLPSGWKTLPLSELCDINPAKPRDFSRDADAPTTFIPMEAVDDKTGAVTVTQVRSYSTVARGYTYFEEGNILFAKITPCMQNGKATIVTGLIDGIGFGSTEFHVLRVKPCIDPKWIHYLLRSAEFRKQAEDNFEGSAGQRRVPDSFLKNVQVPFCEDEKERNILMNHTDNRMNMLYKMRSVASRQLEAISALPAATLREFFHFGENVNA